MELNNIGKFYFWSDMKLIQLLKTISEDEFFKKPAENIMSLKELVDHLIISYDQWSIGFDMNYIKNLVEKLKTMNKNQSLKMWKESVEKFSSSVESFEECNVELPLGSEKTMKIKNSDKLFIYTDHGTYHRGQMITIFKLVTGKDAINTDYYSYLSEQFS